MMLFGHWMMPFCLNTKTALLGRSLQYRLGTRCLELVADADVEVEEREFGFGSHTQKVGGE